MASALPITGPRRRALQRPGASTAARGADVAAADASGEDVEGDRGMRYAVYEYLARGGRITSNLFVSCCICYPMTQAPPNLWVCQKHIKGARRYMKLRAIADLLPRI